MSRRFYAWYDAQSLGTLLAVGLLVVAVAQLLVVVVCVAVL